jgi:hypothetical protein
MTDETIFQLDSIIQRYQKIPSRVFLVFDAYIDMGKGDVSLAFEIRDYDKDLENEAIVDEPISGDPPKSVAVKGITTKLPNRKYLKMTGGEIAFRASCLKQFLLHFCVQPPGKLPDDSHHALLDIRDYSLVPASTSSLDKVRKAIECARKDSCQIIEHCPKKHDLSGLAYCGNRIEQTRALQTVLFDFGYGDEMFYEKYRDDGIYGKRTRLAVSSLCREINALEKLYTAVEGKPIETTLDTSGDSISAFIRDLILLKCEKGWKRRIHYDFDDPSWDLFRDMQLDRDGNADELSWLKWRRHVAQLQNDMICFKFGAEEDFGEDDRIIDKRHPKGLGYFGERTFDAVKRFQEEAAKGARFDAVRQQLVYREEPTFKGAPNGIVDAETKYEIKRWYDFAKAAMKLQFEEIEDDAPTADLSGMEIVVPSLGCAALCKPGQEISVLVAVSEEVAEEQIAANLALFLFLVQPSDPSRPFAFDQRQDNVVRFEPDSGREKKYELKRATLVAECESGMGRLYQGTKEGAFSTRAARIDFDFEDYLDKNFAPDVKAEITKRIWKIYDRKYDGIIKSTEAKKKNLWSLVLKLKDETAPGIYLLKVKGGIDFSAHPVRVFEKEKAEYAVAHLTDVHMASRYDDSQIGAYEPFLYNNPNERLRDFIRSLKNEYNRQEVDFVIITGDVIDYCNDHRPYDLEEKDGKKQGIFNEARNIDANWRALHTILTNDPGISVPFYISLGNHDLKHNPESLQDVGNELALEMAEMKKYPYDQQDTERFSTIINHWLVDRYCGDVLFADENAAEFYFRNFCPYTDFVVSVDDLNFILMNTGADKNIFFNDFLHDLKEALKYLGEVVSGNLPPPISVGFTPEQEAWLGKVLAEHADAANILCLHTPIINPEIPHAAFLEKTLAEQGAAPSLALGEDDDVRISDIAGWGCEDFLDRDDWLSDETSILLKQLAGTPPRSWIPYSDDDFKYIAIKKRLIEEAVASVKGDVPLGATERMFKRPFTDADKLAIRKWVKSPLYKNLAVLDGLKGEPGVRHNASSIEKGRAGLIEKIGAGKIKLALTGHTHTNMEIRAERKDGGIRFFAGNYSDSDQNLEYFNKADDALLLTTISGGFLGRDYGFPVDSKPDDYNLRDHKFINVFFRAGYRRLVISSNGEIRKFGVSELHY